MKNVTCLDDVLHPQVAYEIGKSVGNLKNALANEIVRLDDLNISNNHVLYMLAGLLSEWMTPLIEDGASKDSLMHELGTVCDGLLELNLNK